MYTAAAKGICKRVLAVLLLAVLALGCLALAACADTPEEAEGGEQPSGVEQPSEEEDAPAGEWQYFTYAFTDTAGEAAQLDYALYVPAAYEGGASLPLITYIPDSTYVGKSISNVVKAAGPVNWATDEKMSETPAFFLTFAFKETSSDIYTEGAEGAQIVPVIESVVEDYGIDEDRLYLTGQSMGGITDFALNDAYPEMFAATVYVGCQPGDEVGDEMYERLIASGAFAGQKFVYIASRMDEKAPYGQDDVEKVLIQKGVAYKKLYDLDHTDAAALDDLVRAALEEGYSCNLFGFKQLTSSGNGAAEHMQSFKYCYAIDAIFDWLMAQSK